MQALLARLPRLSVGQRRLTIGVCILMAAISMVPTGGRSSADGDQRVLAVPGDLVSTVVTVDADAASTLHGGERIDLVDPGRDDAFGTPETPRIIGPHVLVLSVSSTQTFGRQTRHLVVATDPATALRLASTQGNRTLAVISLPP